MTRIYTREQALDRLAGIMGRASTMHPVRIAVVARSMNTCREILAPMLRFRFPIRDQAVPNLLRLGDNVVLQLLDAEGDYRGMRFDAAWCDSVVPSDELSHASREVILSNDDEARAAAMAKRAEQPAGPVCPHCGFAPVSEATWRETVIANLGENAAALVADLTKAAVNLGRLAERCKAGKPED